MHALVERVGSRQPVGSSAPQVELATLRSPAWLPAYTGHYKRIL
jgi:hypothetical protein